MKRPEGFDGRRPQPDPGRRPPTGRPGGRKEQSAPSASATPPRMPRSESQREPERRAARPSKPERPVRSRDREPRIRPSRADHPAAAARRELREQARERRRAEKAEVRRFTRRARHRRAVLGTLAGLVALLVTLVLVAVYSPALALRTIVVEGASRVDPVLVQTAVSGQLGTPLALVDFSRLQRELGAFPLIRSYVAETVPPDTIIIRIQERQPVASVLRAGAYDLIDPAGVPITTTPDRQPGYPLVELGAAGLESTAFRSMVEVLLALPPELLGTVDTISATTQDDVTLLLAGGQRVRWGDASDSFTKARVLSLLIAANPDSTRTGTYDVSAPGNAVFSPDPEPPPPPTPEGEVPPDGEQPG